MEGTLQGIWHVLQPTVGHTTNASLQKVPQRTRTTGIRGPIAQRARLLLVKRIVSMKCLVEGTVQTVCDVRKRTRSCGTVQLVQAEPHTEQTYHAFVASISLYKQW